MSGEAPRNNRRPNHNHNTHAPSAYAGRPNAHDDLNWLDYLRSAGGTVRDEPRPSTLNRTDSAERKRRHTGSEPQRRTHRHPYQSYNNDHTYDYGNSNSNLFGGDSHRHTHAATNSLQSSNVPGSTMNNPVDLTFSPRRPVSSSSAGESSITRMISNQREAERRASEVTVPQWQPDHEATECPVCHQEFSIFHRRHHCRKCGRVVCSTCSPHRITIPRQYIVQPPNPFEDEAHPSNRDNPALGGGEVVRVCKPCVPDPMYPSTNMAPQPTSAQNPDRAGAAMHQAASRNELPSRYVRRAASPTRNRSQTLPETPQRQRHAVRNNAQPYEEGYRFLDRPMHRRHPSTLDQFPSEVIRESEMLSPNTSERLHITSERLERAGGYQNGTLFPSQPPGPRALPPAIPTPPPFRYAPPARAPPPPPMPAGGPRRDIKEEDECPVCGDEMPPGEAIRERHIAQCIETRFSSSSSAPPATGAIAPAPASREAASNTPEGSRPRTTSFRSRGMALFLATEKDCVTENGEAQECVICFDEFEEGEEMGRMECLCKFHRKCIKQWWKTKGQGSCPTHQLHE